MTRYKVIMRSWGGTRKDYMTGLTYEPEWIIPVNDLASFDKFCLIIAK